LSGSGVIDGRGLGWINLQLSRPKGEADVSRPAVMLILRARWFFMSGLTLRNSPMYNIRAWGSDMVFENLTILTKEWECNGSQSAPNSDGIQLHAKNVLVKNVRIHNGDDCVPIFESDNIHIQNLTCECGTNGVNLVMSSPGPVSISNIVANNLFINTTNTGMNIQLSTEADGQPNLVKTTGYVTNVSWNNVRIVNPRYVLFRTNAFTGTSNTLPAEWPNISSFQVTNVRVSNVSALVHWSVCHQMIYCSAGFPCSNFLFENVSVSMYGTPGYYKRDCWHSSGKNTSECVNVQNVVTINSPTLLVSPSCTSSRTDRGRELLATTGHDRG